MKPEVSLSRRGACFLFVFVIGGMSNVAVADTIRLDGTIIQSTGDGTGPAVNNISLNDIATSDAYTLDLIFSGLLPSAPGTYDLTGSALTFNDASAGATENAFDLISLTLSSAGLFTDFSLLGCLTTGSGCASGNQLNANFRILSSALYSQNAAAIGLDLPHPFVLLEDDGITDIQGSITQYSYSASTPGSPVPEPSSLLLLGSGIATLVARMGRRRQPKIGITRSRL